MSLTNTLFTRMIRRLPALSKLLTPRHISPARRWTALGIAVAADAAQICLFPLFGEGFLSPLDDGLEVLVAASLFGLIGWHPALLPGIMIEALPVADLAPTWTAAVLLASTSRPAASSSDVPVTSQLR